MHGLAFGASLYVEDQGTEYDKVIIALVISFVGVRGSCTTASPHLTCNAR